MSGRKQAPMHQNRSTTVKLATGALSKAAVRRMPGNQAMAKLFRAVKEEEPCPKCSGKLQRQANVGADVEEVPPIVYDVLRSPGQPLDDAVRTDMEARFGGADFNDVRIHTDARAAESAAAVNAKAYTVGQNIVFGSAQLRANQLEGQRLLAHELVHTQQQNLIDAQSSMLPEALTLRRQEDNSDSTESEKIDDFDNCKSLLQEIRRLVELLKMKFKEALRDDFDLYESHYDLDNRHPEKGSWIGHKNNYEELRSTLKRILLIWNNNSQCRHIELTTDDQFALNEGDEFVKEKPFPECPDYVREQTKTLDEIGRQELKDKFLTAMKIIGIGALIISAAAIAIWGVLALATLVAAALLKIAAALLALGLSASVVALIMQTAGFESQSGQTHGHNV